MRRVCIAAACAAMVHCGGSGSPTTGPSPQPGPPPAPPAPWTLSGVVLNTLTGQPVGNARVEAGSLSATTAEDGRFQLSQPSAPAAALPSSITAPQYLARQTVFGWPRTAPEVQLDVIALSPPFSLPFYQQLVRDGLESAQLGPVYRWTAPPRLALHPFDDSGRPIPTEVLETMRATIPRAVAAWSGGLFVGVQLEQVSMPDWSEGWIVLHVLRSRSSDFCGTGQFRYRGPGRIVTGRVELTLDKCSCGSRKISPNTVSHEIAHVMGFWHVEGRHILGATGAGCSSFENEVITAKEADHARIAYRRPPGNLDPDRDPDGTTMATDGSAGQSRGIVCRP